MSTLIAWTLPLFLLQAAAPPAVSVEDDVSYEGQSSFRIRTPSATYIYHKEGGAFASLKDRDGIEWIGYRPGGGSAGEFRGIPNFGGFGHPGYEGEKGSVSKILKSTPEKVSILTERAGKWAWRWDFHATHATCTILKTNQPYWILYEGTPGGKLDLENGYLVLASGERRSLANQWAGDLPQPEWLYFTGENLKRSLFLAMHEDDNASDQYWPMEGNMTVFGFGRQHRCCGRYLTAEGASFSIGLVESKEHRDVEQSIGKAIKMARVE